MEGWVKIHRKILDNPIVCKDADYLAIWIYLLLNATHKEVPALFKGKKIMLQPGQLITGRKSIAKELGINETKVWRVINEYKSEHQLEQQASNQNSLISILNWDRYQINEQPMNNERTANEQRVNTNKNERIKENNNLFILNKEDEEEKNESLYEKFLEKYKSSEKDFYKKLKAISKMRDDPEYDKLTHDEQMRLQTEIFMEVRS